jgi:hypothetical protein
MGKGAVGRVRVMRVWVLHALGSMQARVLHALGSSVLGKVVFCHDAVAVRPVLVVCATACQGRNLCA